MSNQVIKVVNFNNNTDRQPTTSFGLLIKHQPFTSKIELYEILLNQKILTLFFYKNINGVNYYADSKFEMYRLEIIDE